jgi:hypothetical protein
MDRNIIYGKKKESQDKIIDELRIVRAQVRRQFKSNSEYFFWIRKKL